MSADVFASSIGRSDETFLRSVLPEISRRRDSMKKKDERTVRFGRFVSTDCCQLVNIINSGRTRSGSRTRSSRLKCHDLTKFR